MQHISKTIEVQERILFEDIEEQVGFTPASNLTLFDTDLSDQAFRLYLKLKNHGWSGKGIFPGQKKLAEESKKEPRQIRNLLNELKEKKYITWKKTGMGRTNNYTILKRYPKSTQKKV